MRWVVQTLLLMSMLLPLAIAQSLPDEITARMKRVTADAAPGVALLVVHQGKTLIRKTYGRAYMRTGVHITPETTFRMASVSKQFTAAAIHRLIEQGKIRPDDTLDRFFPMLPEWSRSITIRHMLTHTSGIWDAETLLQDDDGRIIPAHPSVRAVTGVDWQELRQVSDADYLPLLAQTRQTYFPAGAQFRYSNTAYCLLEQIVENVSGVSYATFMAREFFVPLGMKHTRIYDAAARIPHRAYGYAREAGRWTFRDQSQTSATLGDGGVYTSLADYHRWIVAMQGDRPKVNVQAWAGAVSAAAQGDGFYGAGWFFDQNGVFFHSGTTCGFSNLVVWIPQTETLFVWFSNRADDHASAQPVLDLLRDAEILPADVWAWHAQTQ